MLISIYSKSHLVWLVSSTSQIMLYAVVESVSSAAGLVNTGCNKLTFGGDQLELSQVQGLTQTSLQEFFMFFLSLFMAQISSTTTVLPVWYFCFSHFGHFVSDSRRTNMHKLENCFSPDSRKCLWQFFGLCFCCKLTRITVNKGYIYNPSADKSAL